MNSTRPLFSLCHATRRLPDGWKAAADDWMEKADYPNRIEYRLCIDARAARALPRSSVPATPGFMFVDINPGVESAGAS